MEQLSGVIHPTGEPDSGKTTFAFECGAAPEKIWVAYDDIKTRTTVEDLAKNGTPVGRAIDLIVLTKGKTELDAHEAIMGEIRKIKPGEFDCIIFDTWTYFANTTHAAIVANPQKYRKNWAPMGKIKGAQEWQEARRLEAEIVNHLTTLATTVVLITHLKDVYLNGIKVPGKQEPACSSVMEHAARLRIWLRPNPNGGVPIGLVLKRLNKKHLVNGKIRTVDVLPRKITPRPGEASLWDSIERYWEDPIKDRAPLPDEIPTEYELGILDSTLTDEQKVILHEMLESGMMQKQETEAVAASVENNGDLVEQARALQQQKKPVPVIAKELGLSVAEVQSLLKHEEVAFT